MSAIGKRYARAAVEAADEKGGAASVEELAQGLRRFNESHQASAELQELLNSPVFENERPKVLGLVLDELKVSSEVRGLIRLLSERKRIKILDAVAEEVEFIADERAGRQRAYVSSVIPLSDPQKERIAQALGKRIGRKIVVNVDIDPSLLGGLICRVGDLTLDSSLRRQLEVLREQLEKHAN